LAEIETVENVTARYVFINYTPSKGWVLRLAEMSSAYRFPATFVMLQVPGCELKPFRGLAVLYADNAGVSSSRSICDHAGDVHQVTKV
jgi:hypothetical protein